jgi:hypothetical protein
MLRRLFWQKQGKYAPYAVRLGQGRHLLKKNEQLNDGVQRLAKKLRYSAALLSIGNR